MPQYTTIQDFLHALFYRWSSILQGICFLIGVYVDTKIKGLDLGKSYIIGKKPERDQLRAPP